MSGRNRRKAERSVHWMAALSLTVLIGSCAAEPEPVRTTAAVEPPADAFLDVGDVTLHYLDWGGQGDLVLLVPGVTATAHVWNAVAPHLADQYRVIAVTRREHGASEKTSQLFDLDVLADDLAAVIEAFSSTPAVVVGHSYAGLELPRLYSRHPDKVRALVFVDALYDGPALLSAPLAAPGFGLPDSTYRTLEEAVEWFHQFYPTVRSELAAHYVRSQMRETDSGVWVWQLPVPGPRLGEFFALYGSWTPADYEGMGLPVLAIHADQARYMAANLELRGYPADSIALALHWARQYDNAWKTAAVDALLGAVPGAVSVTLDSTSHMVPLERPDTLLSLIRRFLASHVHE